MDQVVGASLKDAVAAGAGVLVPEVETRAPKGETLQLVGSVGDEPSESSHNRAVHKVYVRRYYALFQEYGTSKMAAQPFFRPAIDAKQGEIAEAVQAEVLSASRRVTG